MTVRTPPLKVGEEISLLVERLGVYGEGVAHWQGFTVFVEGALPGEEVVVKVVEVKATYARAHLQEMKAASPHRVRPPCPVFGRCGGCQLQHLTYLEQLKIKRQKVVDALERIGKLKGVEVLPCVPSPHPLGYRNKIQLPLGKGLYAFNSHDLVEIERCLIHTPLGEKAFQALRKFTIPGLKHLLIKTAVHTNQVLVVLITAGKEDLSALAKEMIAVLPEIKGIVENIAPKQGNRILGPTFRTLAGQSFIEDKIGEFIFKVSPSSFFQVNPQQAENLYQKAIEAAALTGSERVLDAYCGVGTLSLYAARYAKEVVGIEVVKEAIEDARSNALRNKIGNVTFHVAQVEKCPLAPHEVAILNPPRKGCDPLLLKKLALMKPHIVYISCDPATLARDLAYLVSQGYRVDMVEPFDMFPQTTHVETLVKLTF